MVATRLLQNGLFTLRNRPILMNLSREKQTPTPLYWSKHISTDLRDSRGWSIWFEKNGIPEKNGKITSLHTSSDILSNYLNTNTSSNTGHIHLDTTRVVNGSVHFKTTHLKMNCNTIQLTKIEIKYVSIYPRDLQTEARNIL